jgi:signal transduction histidine kinase
MVIQLTRGNLDKQLMAENKFKPRLESESLFGLLEETIQLMSIKAQNKKVLIKICEDQTIDLILIMDRVRIQQILINLIDNAIKFAHVRSNIELIVKV